jgi:hypothetical protein
MPDEGVDGAREWLREAGAAGGAFAALPPPPRRPAPSASALPAAAALVAPAALAPYFDAAPDAASPPVVLSSARFTRSDAINANAAEWRLKAPAGATPAPGWWG